MKKILALSLLAIAAFVSQAWAQEWTTCTGEYAGYCKWSATACNEIASGPPPDGKATCKEAYENCEKYGGVYSDAACTQAVGTPIEACGYDCDWGTGGCWEIKTNPTGANNSAVTTTCEQAIANCDKDGIRYPSHDNTCSGAPLAGDESCGKYCKWETGCVEIKTDKDGQHNPTPVTSCSDALSNCSTNGQMFNDAACTVPTTDPTGIKFTPASQALIVAPYGRSLHISSAREAMVSLYDMSGARVYSGRVSAGNRVFSLERVASGSYYAVVQAGSSSKKVPVILK